MTDRSRIICVTERELDQGNSNMAAIIEVMGKEVSFDGKNWTSEDASAAKLCRLTAQGLPYAYYPDAVGDLATAVAADLEGRVIHIDPLPPNNNPPGTIY